MLLDDCTSQMALNAPSTMPNTLTAVIFLMPLLIVMLTIIFSYVRSLIGNYASIPYNVLYIIGSFLLVWILFSGAYKMIPNTKVKLSCAFKAGLVASVVFFVVYQC